jgi:hypothetical protein
LVDFLSTRGIDDILIATRYRTEMHVKGVGGRRQLLHGLYGRLCAPKSWEEGRAKFIPHIMLDRLCRDHYIPNSESID